MSRRKYPPDYGLAKAVEDTVFRASASAYAIKDTDPERAERLIRWADQAEANYLSERGEHYWQTIRRTEDA
jgi:hypothetical protein